MKTINIDKSGLKLEAIYRRTNKLTLSKSVSATIVGGRTKLERLVGEGKIRAEKPTNAQNGKWYCNASDVLRHAKV